MVNDKNKKIIIKNCSQPSTDAKAIIKALKYKNQPNVKIILCIRKIKIKRNRLTINSLCCNFCKFA